MSETFKEYRRDCFTAIRELLAHKPAEKEIYLVKAKRTKTPEELSRLMVDVRHEI